MLAHPSARSTSHLWVQVPLYVPPLEGHHGHVQETHVRPEPLANLHVSRGRPLISIVRMAISGFDRTEKKARGDTGQQRENSRSPLPSIFSRCRGVHLLVYFVRGENPQGSHAPMASGKETYDRLSTSAKERNIYNLQSYTRFYNRLDPRPYELSSQNRPPGGRLNRIPGMKIHTNTSKFCISSAC